MKQEESLKTLILMCIGFVIVASGMIGLVLMFNNAYDKEDKQIVYVTGDKHVYKGQLLDPIKMPSPLLLLTKRASYLNESEYLAIPAKLAIEDLINDAEKSGMCIVVISGYRTPERQQKLYNQAKDKSLVALPNESEHQTGLAVDLGACPMKDGVRYDLTERPELANDFDTLPEYQWLLKNAARYGFEESFRADNTKTTGFPAESWHWKFIIN